MFTHNSSECVNISTILCTLYNLIHGDEDLMYIQCTCIMKVTCSIIVNTIMGLIMKQDTNGLYTYSVSTNQRHLQVLYRYTVHMDTSAPGNTCHPG